VQHLKVKKLKFLFLAVFPSVVENGYIVNLTWHNFFVVSEMSEPKGKSLGSVVVNDCELIVSCGKYLKSEGVGGKN